MTRRVARVAGGVAAAAVVFTTLGVVEVSTRLHEYGGLQIIGPPRPSPGAALAQAGTVTAALICSGLFAKFVVPSLGRPGTTSMIAVLLGLASASLLLFTEPTYEAYGRSMDLSVDRIAHAASTSASIFVFAGLSAATLFDRSTRPPRDRETT